jgi:hypothetical protein
MTAGFFCFTVIPGRAPSREPGIHVRFWIPGSTLRVAPE